MKPKNDVPTIPRSKAADILDEIRVHLARRTPPEEVEELLKINYEISPLIKCKGEAHGNAYIDNCVLCAPRWGWKGKRIKIT